MRNIASRESQDINGVATTLSISVWGDLDQRDTAAIGAFCFLAVASFALRPLSLPDSFRGLPLRDIAHDLAHIALFVTGVLSCSALVDALLRSLRRALRVEELGMRPAFREIAAWLSPVLKVPAPSQCRSRFRCFIIKTQWHTSATAFRYSYLLCGAGR